MVLGADPAQIRWICRKTRPEASHASDQRPGEPTYTVTSPWRQLVTGWRHGDVIARREWRHHDAADGEVDDEVVGGRSHVLLSPDDEDDGAVTEHRSHDYDAIHGHLRAHNRANLAINRL